MKHLLLTINKKSPLYQSSIILLESSVLVGSNMFFVYCLGKNSFISTFIIYGPITIITIYSIHQRFSCLYIFSCLLSITHGIAHILYPFLNEQIGVNIIVDVWQDQIIHMGQSILATAIFFNNSNSVYKFLSSLFILSNVLNVIVGYKCWGNYCHNIYVLLSIIPSLSSGLHFASASFFKTQKNVAVYGFILQGCMAVITNLLFKEYNELLKLFAICRFFEIYFIVPHYIGLLNNNFNFNFNFNIKNIKYHKYNSYFS